MQIGFQDRLLLGAFVFILLAQANDRTKRRDIIAVAFGLGINVADVVRNGLFFFFKMLDALDDRLELILCEARGRAFLGLVLDGGGGGYGGHEGLPALTQRICTVERCASRRDFARHDPTQTPVIHNRVAPPASISAYAASFRIRPSARCSLRADTWR